MKLELLIDLTHLPPRPRGQYTYENWGEREMMGEIKKNKKNRWNTESSSGKRTIQPKRNNVILASNGISNGPQPFH